MRSANLRLILDPRREAERGDLAGSGSRATWGALLVGTLAVGYAGRNTRLLFVSGFDVHLKWALQSLGIGIVVGLLIRMAKAGRVARRTA